MRWCRQQHVDVVGRYRSPYDHHLPRLADLSDQVARTLCQPPPQNFVPILRNPYDVILEIVDRVRGAWDYEPTSSFKDQLRASLALTEEQEA